MNIMPLLCLIKSFMKIEEYAHGRVICIDAGY